MELYVREVAAESLVLVLSPTRILVQQWVDRLRADDAVPVTNLTSAQVALHLLEEPAAPRTGVLVATYARTQHGPSSRALSELDFGLIVHDQPPRKRNVDVDRLNSRAVRAIAVVDPSYELQWGPEWPLLWTISGEQLAADGYLKPTTSVPFTATADERDLRRDAIALLAEFASRSSKPFVLSSDSLPALHERLLAVASALAGQDLAERAWELLDRMENSLSTDTRLEVLGESVSAALAEGARCVVLAETPRDATYIADHLVTQGTPPRAVITASVSAADRRSALGGLGVGECLVATRVIGESAEDWPSDLTVILWPSPSNRSMLVELLLVAELAPGLTVVELTETNPLGTIAP
ncbi:hypothetical protein [Amycolatopsis sp. 3B14]|uniref:hypothetical protein n=1 Tax=Amycolatopsis sp. 3B14 TaxID=3243600 RepID=UPI003D9896E1